jgi:hypothetical protein
MEISNYVLTFVDSEGNIKLLSSKGEAVDLVEKPLYSSFENAEKNRKKLLNILETVWLDRAKYWFNEINVNPDKFVNPGEKERLLKMYNDYLIIKKNGLDIKKVKITMELN